MSTQSGRREATGTPDPVISWLLASDPCISWQTLRDLVGEPGIVFGTVRDRIAVEGWGAQLLSLQHDDGMWGDGHSAPRWQATLCALTLLREMGLDPKCRQARSAIALVRDHVKWGPQFGSPPFLEGEVEPCINGRVLAIGAYFGYASEGLLARLLDEQLADGGWNCEAECGSVRSSFHTTICVLEGLLEFETAFGPRDTVTTARERAHEYLLERQLLRRRSTGEIVSDRKGQHDWTLFTFPTTWHYDILRGLDYLRAAEIEPDDRAAEVVEIVRQHRRSDGRWPLHIPHDDPIGFIMEKEPHDPSRWNTLRALRAQDWFHHR